MRISRITIDNWRNFKHLDVPIDDRLFVVGPNAAGKSNLLDLFRFLGDIARPGGGLATAMGQRGGFRKVRSLHARNHKTGRVIVDVALTDRDDVWRYKLSIKGEVTDKNRFIVDEERVERNGEVLLQRPNSDDEADAERLTQTHLEQLATNQQFREVAHYFGKVQYFHLIPQVIRDSARAGIVGGDPFGGDFIAQLNDVPERTRQAWLQRIERALKSAIPEFESLRIEVDSAGRPHLVAGYQHWQSTSAGQNEADFSDGTLRLIGLLWTIVQAPANGGMLLLEEPELSLNPAIVRMLSTVLAMAQRDTDLQTVVTTYSPELLADEGINPDEVLVLRVGSDGTTPVLMSQIPEIADQLEAQLPLPDMINELIAPRDLGLSGIPTRIAR